MNRAYEFDRRFRDGQKKTISRNIGRDFEMKRKIEIKGLTLRFLIAIAMKNEKERK